MRGRAIENKKVDKTRKEGGRRGMQGKRGKYRGRRGKSEWGMGTGKEMKGRREGNKKEEERREEERLGKK